MYAFIDAAARTFQGWSDLYNGSAAVADGVTFVHLSGMLVAGGFAVASDRSVLRAGRAPAAQRAYVLQELDAVHRPVILGLAVVVVTGMAMLLSDVRTFLPSPVFWLKMGLLVLLLGNGLQLQRAERRLLADPEEPHGWRALRGAAVRSVGLWITMVLVGVALTSVS